MTPERSALFSLPPIGIGTGAVECLTSYIGRLAWAHSVSTSKLVTNLIAPATGRKYFGKANPDVLARCCSSAVNASGITATTFVSVIEHLTGLSDLHLLTLSHWFPWPRMKSAVSPHKVWCSYCYEDARDAKREVVDQLIWTLKDITVCSVHSSKLLDMCPKCNTRSPWLERYTFPGYCSRCKVWLGQSRSLKDQRVDNSGDEYPRWCAESLANLFAAGKGFMPSTEEQLLKKLGAFLAHGSSLAFSTLLDVNSSTVYGWAKKGSFPGLKGILKISRLSGINLTGYLDSKIPACNLGFPEVQLTRKKRNLQVSYDRSKLRALAVKALCEHPPPSLTQVATRIRKSSSLLCRTSALNRLVPKLSRQIVNRHLRYNRTLTERRRRSLRAFASGKRKPPIGINEVAQLLQVTRSHLHKLCPKSCKAIRIGFKVHQRKMRELREIAIEQEIRDAAFSLHEQGLYPSFTGVSALLTASSWLARESRRQVLRKIQIELGYRRPI